MSTILTLAELARLIGAEYKGNADCQISSIATLQAAKPGQLSFLANSHYRKYLAETQASAVILAADDLQYCPVNALITKNPYLGYAKAATAFAKNSSFSPGIHPSVIVGERCIIHKTVSIAANCVIGSDVTIGENVQIHPGCVIGNNSHLGASSCFYANVTFYHDVQIGERAIIHSGAVIGSDGFGLANDQGTWYKIPQMGKVVIGDDVEIGANTTIDRGALEDTIIENGVKIDNQVQIGHNVRIGAHTAIAGCTGISGSSKIGKYCMIGGAVGIAGHIEIADRTVVTGMAMVTHSITAPGGMYSSGTGIQENKIWQKNAVRFRQLDEIARRLTLLEKQFEKE